jgi:DNA (cytosine-5)-methyltransferase 1
MIDRREIILDCFAGGGGASHGIERALGRHVDYAVNHNAKALAVHMANHPRTVHLHENIRNLDPGSVAPGRQIGLGWFSPDCTYYSKARGGKPFRDTNRARRIRGLATSVIWWMRERRPRVVMLENVEEFSQWGPLLEDGTPCPVRRGQSFRRWHRRIENLGYRVDMRQLVAADHGAGTTRRRLFVVARCDDGEIVFPERTHGPGLQPYVTAADCIDWSIPCPSIFTRRKPLAEATMARIARGVMRYVVNNARPFIVPYHSGDVRVHSIDEPLRTQTTENRYALVAPTLINTRNGERVGQAPRVRDIQRPYPTITAQGSQGALVAAFLARHYGGHENDGHPLNIPVSTITTKDHHHLVYAFLMKYYKRGGDASLFEPLPTQPTKDRFALVTINGVPHEIVDIGMRMLEPRELALATSFGPDYILDPIYEGKPLSKTDQVWMIGNAVPPAVAEALVRANFEQQQSRQVA